MALEMKYFVLKPSGRSPFSEASRAAMGAYADIIYDIDPCLAEELRNWAVREAVAAIQPAERQGDGQPLRTTLPAQNTEADTSGVA